MSAKLEDAEKMVWEWCGHSGKVSPTEGTTAKKEQRQAELGTL